MRYSTNFVSGAKLKTALPMHRSSHKGLLDFFICDVTLTDTQRFLVGVKEHLSRGSGPEPEGGPGGGWPGWNKRTWVTYSLSGRSWYTYYGYVNSLSVPSKFFVLLRKSILNRFQQTRSQMKAYHYIFRNKKENQYFQIFKNFMKKVFLRSKTILEHFCYLPTYRFDFNKWDLK